MKKLLILPFCGEFGWFTCVFIRRVHLLEADEKIVCCKPGQEVFFPSATGFFYDYELELLDHEKKGPGGWHSPKIDKLGEDIISRYPVYAEHELVMPFEKWHCYNNFDKAYTFFELSPKPIDTNVDIVISGRNRNLFGNRNWDKWPELVPKLQEAGYKVGVVGAPDTSFDMDFVDERAWDYDSFDDATVAMMQRASLILTTNTGIAHLGVFLRKPMIVIDNAGYQMMPWMDTQRDPNVYFCVLPETRSDLIIQTTLCALKKGL